MLPHIFSPHNKIVHDYLDTFNVPKQMNITFWKTSGAGAIPNGKRVKIYRPNGVLKVASLLLSLVSLTCQKPWLASRTLNSFALGILLITSSTVCMGKCSRITARLRSLGSRHTPTLFFFFLATTRLCTQAVGCVHFLMTPTYSILWSFSLRGSRICLVCLCRTETLSKRSLAFEFVYCVQCRSR